MKRLALGTWVCLWGALTLVGAVLLTRYFDTLPFNMPYWLDRAIRFGFHLFLHEDMPDPDDEIAPVAGLFYFTCAIALVGVLAFFVAAPLWRRFIGPRFARR